MEQQGSTSGRDAPPTARRGMRVDRSTALILLPGLAIVVLVLFVIDATVSSERDHTRGALVVQRVGAALATASIELREAAAGGAQVAGAERIVTRVADAEQLLRGHGGGSGFGRVQDGEIRDDMSALADDVRRWRLDLPAALRSDGSPAQRAAVAAEADALRRRNGGIVDLVQSRIESDDRRVTLLKWGLVGTLGLLLCLLAWQVARSRRALRSANDDLRARVDERTAQLARSEAQVRVVIESSLDALVVIDGDGVIREWNPRAEELLGAPREQMVGQRPPDESSSVKARDYRERAFARYAETHDPNVFSERFEDVVTTEAGSFQAEISVSAARIGEELMISYVVRDITERVRAQAELEDARDAAERAASAKSSFLATMSHEIRTPMNAIVGMTSLLIDSPLEPTQRSYVETIRSSGEALLTVINDILDFSKIESGKLDLEHHPFAVREVIESALGLLAPQAAANEIDLGYLLETDGSTGLVGDSTRLRQVLINLLANAVKFTPEGSVTIHGRLTGAGDGRALLSIEVRDTGIGIPPDRVASLFDSFSQVDASTTRRYGGTGLGLAISKRLVEAMGGTLNVTSVMGEGSTFTLALELERVPGADPVYADVPETLRGCHVLVVDDNEVNREILEHQLAGWGMDVVAFERPSDALALVRAGEWFDVAILDMQMPEMDGLSLADQLSEATAFSLPIVLLSSIGGVDPELARGRLAATLSKPVQPVTLRSALAGALTGGTVPIAPLDEPTACALPKHRLRVLVAEDNVVNQQVALATLERLGHLADVAGDGVEAIEAVNRQAYDLVLMDVQMPTLDGLEATRRIRAELPADRQPRIVAMTANAFTEDRDACTAAGMDDFLTKPVPRDELVRVLSATSPSPARAGRSGAAGRDGGPGSVDADAVAALEDDAPLIVDPERLSEAAGGDRMLATTLIDTHEEEGTRLLTAMRSALAAGDVDALRVAAHTLRTASASVGAMWLSRLCATLELAARDDDVVDPEGQVDEIVSVFGLTHAELQRTRRWG